MATVKSTSGVRIKTKIFVIVVPGIRSGILIINKEGRSTESEGAEEQIAAIKGDLRRAGIKVSTECKEEEEVLREERQMIVNINEMNEDFRST